ncbi:glycosyltransferase [Mesorhizobium sp.]|uniref:glycosyltransferase n=1 Tax=Mesorhizobium sp. TaxID=1871066 RepID=UPI000FE957B8|nr:glycosyltransferase [Mesorhizobium sp.]RWK42863.1 MAG: glycosyltransferase [Mesorhizobium sp.]RWK70324.1 MAG: glycosyltransferase [Mesorhizobium sp.]RWK80586.1 MAG: glycosyltransferase [Mesorhizobium sp.]RWK83142.1 MAG: glycosyltransferase [Mesorhizobium sp.]RWL09044.1 MAG: glycosyltransferase [Mesorhizobium sp.]
MRLTAIGQVVGLVRDACFTDFGHEVECVDLDDRRIDALEGGKMPKKASSFLHMGRGWNLGGRLGSRNAIRRIDMIAAEIPAANPMKTPRAEALPSTRVLLVLPTYFPESYGGGEQQTRRFARALIERGVSVTILAPRLSHSTPKRSAIDGVPIERLRLHAAPNLGGRHMLSFLSWCVQLVIWMLRRRDEFDVVHIIHARLHALPAALAGALLRKPVLAKMGRGGRCFDLDVVREKKIVGRWASSVIKRHVSAFIANSRQIEGDLKRHGIEADRIHMIPNGIDLPHKPRRQPSTDDTRRFICLGRLEPEKCLEHMIDAFAALPAEAQAQLTVLGDGQCRAALEEQTVRLGLSGRVKFAGAVEDVFPFLWKSDFYLSTSVSEGMSNALLEAMSCGVVPIITDVSGASDIVEHERSGFLARSHVEYSRLLLRALGLSEAERNAMAQNAVQTIAGRFSMESVATRQMRLYAALVDTATQIVRR